MRILWFTNTTSNYSISSGYNGGGWISTLENEISKREGIELGVSFILNHQPQKVERGNVTYYPIPNKYATGALVHLQPIFSSFSKIDRKIVEDCLKVVDDFKPDIIQVFGVESCFGLIAKETKIPVLVHIQGILHPIFNAFLPPFMSWSKYMSCLNPVKAIKRLSSYYRWQHNCRREREIFRHVRYFCGRTEWDKQLSSLLSPQRSYYHVDEILRDVFYESVPYSSPKRLTIVSTISDMPYKGTDMILKTAKVLKESYLEDFEWQVYGLDDASDMEHLTGIRASTVNVKLCGIATAEALKEKILATTVFANLSYIDNSPNSLCEAQILGCPVVATDVGGKTSLLTDKEDGILVPANDPYIAAAAILEIFNHPEWAQTLGRNGSIRAKKRHDRKTITNSLIDVYHQIVSKETRESSK